MYYAEEIINGVLCYKTTPDGDWTPLSLTVLTERLTDAKKLINDLQNQLFNFQEDN